LASTWPSNDLLLAIRSALEGADDAILCVAFANRRGVNLLQPQLSLLGRRCRLLVTSAFGGQTTGDALAAAADLRVHVRILNPPAGTFHSKLYLARTPGAAVSVVGSANLTSGLVANIESALVLSGTVRDQPIAECWTLAEELWEHSAAHPWTATERPRRADKVSISRYESPASPSQVLRDALQAVPAETRRRLLRPEQEDHSVRVNPVDDEGRSARGRGEDLADLDRCADFPFDRSSHIEDGRTALPPRQELVAVRSYHNCVRRALSREASVAGTPAHRFGWRCMTSWLVVRKPHSA
jgi:HKD family nuclease